VTAGVSVDNRILERLSALSADQHVELRSALAVAAVAYRREAPILARVWCAFADCGHTDAAISKALNSCGVDDLEHVRAVLVGAELGSRRNTRLRDAWGACRDVVADELARRKATAPAAPTEPAAPVAQEPVPTGSARTRTIIDLIRSSPSGIPTESITARLGGSATRSALHRLRRAGVVELRDGRNYLRNTEATPERTSA